MFSKSLLTSLSLSFVSVLPNFKIEYKFIVRIGKAEGIYQNHSSSEQQNLIFAYTMFYWHHRSSGLKLGRLVCRPLFREQEWWQFCYHQHVIIKVSLGISIPVAGRGNSEGTHRKNLWLCLDVTLSISVFIHWLKFRYMAKSKCREGWEM